MMRYFKIVVFIYMCFAPKNLLKGQETSIDSLGLKTTQWLEDFNNNHNNWDVYTSRKTESEINKGVYYIKSHIARGTVRYISIPLTGSDFEIETQLKIVDGQRGCRIGLIFGFKDFDNYNFFLIRFNKYYIGHVRSGEIKYLINGLELREEIVSSLNKFKIETDFDKCNYYLNNVLLVTLQTPAIVGENIGFILEGIAAVKVNWLRITNKNIAKNEQEKIIFSKPILNGLCIHKKGYVITNLVPDLLKHNIIVEVAQQTILKHYKAKLVAKDSINNLALLKINDSLFHLFEDANFKINAYPFLKENQNQFCVQLLLQNSLKLKHAHVIKGTLISKKGFASNTSFYQLSQSSDELIDGAPIFTDTGEWIGLFNQQKSNFDGVTYAVKYFYLKNLLDFLPERIVLPNSNELSSLSLNEIIAKIKPALVLIKIY
jgi:hypothetical protein